MNYTVGFSGLLNGKIQLPASKSISNRALILKALSRSSYEIKNLSDCDDTNVMQAAFISDQKIIDIKAAGTAMRFLTAYLSQANGEWVITGTERMKNRPIRVLVDALRQLGATIEYVEKEGFPPLKIQGRQLQGGAIALDGSISSQYISALMMIAPTMTEGLTLNLESEVVSEPYIRMTIEIMKSFGIEVVWKDNYIRIKSQKYNPVCYVVENDWSAASYWYEMILLAPNDSMVELMGLRNKSTQGDAKVAELFDQLGVRTEFVAEGIKLSKQQTVISRFEYDFVSQPDLVQTFVVSCALKNIPFRFTGLQSLKIKETDRIKALQNEMLKLGFIIRDAEDSILEWTGERCKPSLQISIDTYDDHRMAMAFAPAAVAIGKLNINEPLVVTKSYPQFWNDLKITGFSITG